MACSHEAIVIDVAPEKAWALERGIQVLKQTIESRAA
jgi:hypothetical protein